ncbi:MAG: HD domain-containing phosphohydrolase [Vampirovibrionales bacterium]
MPSLDSPQPSSHHDPLEAIYALNIGDFMAESFLSDALLERISNRVANNPNQLKQQLAELVDIYSLNKTLGILGLQHNDSVVLYDAIASTLCNIFAMDACHLFQPVHKAVSGDYLSLTGTSLHLNSTQRWHIGLPVSKKDYLGACFLQQQAFVLQEVSAQPSPVWETIEPLHTTPVTSALIVPLVQRSQAPHSAQGVLCLESYTPLTFDPEQVALAHATGQLLSVSLELQHWIGEAQALLQQEDDGASHDRLQTLRAQLTECIADLGDAQQTFVEQLGLAIDARHQWSKGHSQRVAQRAQTLSEAFGLGEKTSEMIYYAGLVGHLGHLSVPNELLQKESTLSPNDKETWLRHANAGVALLSQLHILADAVPYVTYQSERWDGSGTPNGLKERHIPFGSRILAVADAFEALTHARPYRSQAFSAPEALTILRQEAGSKWDPTVVEQLALQLQI